jgi:glyoxylase-like metal-dependent hydrolase (beta-lactamase superfamily II)
MDDNGGSVEEDNVTYKGEVRPGGPADTRELADLTITKVSVGPMDNNAYLLEARQSGELVLIDAANEAGRLLSLLDGRPLARVVTTHRHQDHWVALADVVTATGAETLAGHADVEGIPVATDRALDDGDEVSVGTVRLRAITIVGHTPGSVALVYDDPDGHPHLFTGDTLFPGGPGRTTRPEDFTSLMNDLEQKIFGKLPDNTWFYPGHGKDSTLGAERPALSEWRARGW